MKRYPFTGIKSDFTLETVTFESFFSAAQIQCNSVQPVGKDSAWEAGPDDPSGYLQLQDSAPTGQNQMFL